jgi:hypothetical protein
MRERTGTPIGKAGRCPTSPPVAGSARGRKSNGRDRDADRPDRDAFGQDRKAGRAGVFKRAKHHTDVDDRARFSNVPYCVLGSMSDPEGA